MKVLQTLLLLTAFIALCNAAATGATGSSEPSKAEEAKVEKAKKKEMEHKVDGMKKEKTAEIKKIVDTAIVETNKYASEQKTACDTEENEAKKWSKEADPATAEKNRLERKKAKEALLAAIEYRKKILKKFLDKLYAARYTLGDSIHRTNNIYFAAYDANVNTQVITREVLAKLGIVFEAKLKKSGGSLGVFTPIKLPNIHDDEVEEEKEERKAGLTDITGATGSATGGATGSAAAAATSLMEIKSMEQHNRDMIRQSLMEVAAQVHKKMVKCVGEECDPAMQEAWILHQEAFDIDCANYKVYDVEQRTPLALYREGLKHLIKVREEKLKALEKQAAELRASLADPGQTLAELFPLIDQHIKIQDVACKKMPINTGKMLKELKQIQADIAQGNFHCMIGTGGEGSDYKIPNEKAPSAETGSTGPATEQEITEETKPVASTASEDATPTASTASEETKPAASTASEEAKPAASTASEETKPAASTASEEAKPSASTASEETKPAASTGPKEKKEIDPVPEETGPTATTSSSTASSGSTGPTGPTEEVEKRDASTASASSTPGASATDGGSTANAGSTAGASASNGGSTASAGSTAGASASNGGSTANDESVLGDTTSSTDNSSNPAGEKPEAVPQTNEPTPTRGSGSSEQGGGGRSRDF